MITIHDGFRFATGVGFAVLFWGAIAFIAFAFLTKEQSDDEKKAEADKKAEAEALKRDAKRYRFIRDYCELSCDGLEVGSDEELDSAMAALGYEGDGSNEKTA